MDLVFRMYAVLIIMAPTNLIEVTGYSSCYYNGQSYPENSIIEETGCSAVVCTIESRIEYWVDEHCPPVIDRKSFQQTLMLAIKRGNDEPCLYKGTTYQPRDEISSFYDEISGYCYGRLCVSGDETILWARPNCVPTQVRSTESNNLYGIVDKLEEHYNIRLYKRVAALLNQNVPPKIQNSEREASLLGRYFPLVSPPKRASLKPKSIFGDHLLHVDSRPKRNKNLKRPIGDFVKIV